MPEFESIGRVIFFPDKNGLPAVAATHQIDYAPISRAEAEGLVKYLNEYLSTGQIEDRFCLGGDIPGRTDLQLERLVPFAWDARDAEVKRLVAAGCEYCPMCNDYHMITEGCVQNAD